MTSSPQVRRLLDRIRRLVAEQERLAGTANRDRREANRREIARLQTRLAQAMKRQLSEAAERR
jgi:hypothetical protein